MNHRTRREPDFSGRQWTRWMIRFFAGFNWKRASMFKRIMGKLLEKYILFIFLGNLMAQCAFRIASLRSQGRRYPLFGYPFSPFGEIPVQTAFAKGAAVMARRTQHREPVTGAGNTPPQRRGHSRIPGSLRHSVGNPSRIPGTLRHSVGNTSRTPGTLRQSVGDFFRASGASFYNEFHFKINLFISF
jgi:hypothetical protein